MLIAAAQAFQPAGGDSRAWRILAWIADGDGGGEMGFSCSQYDLNIFQNTLPGKQYLQAAGQ
jgi:hypothetical protein